MEVKFYDTVDDALINLQLSFQSLEINGYFANIRKGSPLKCLVATERWESLLLILQKGNYTRKLEQ